MAPILHHLVLGLTLGLGAAIPLGPTNLEMTRRNLHHGTPSGMSLGVGACFADATYILIICSGALTFFSSPVALRIISFIGALILGWFGIMALRQEGNTRVSAGPRKKALWRDCVDGYILTLWNPFTVLFWVSVSTQLPHLGPMTSQSFYWAALGVVVGALSWVIFLNLLLHHTRHKLSPKTIRILNVVGGIILLGFAAMGIGYSLKL